MSKKPNFRELLRNAKQKQTWNVKAESGVTYELCRPNLQAYLMSGQIPTSLLEKMLESEGKTPDVIAADLEPADAIAAMKFMGTIVKQALVTPKIVSEPKADDEITFADLPDEDIIFIFQWAKAGGVEGENLRQFRNQPAERPDNSQES